MVWNSSQTSSKSRLPHEQVGLNMVSSKASSNLRSLVACIHFCPFTGECFTDFLFIHRHFSQQQGSFCPFTLSLCNHRRMFNSFTPFTRKIHSTHAKNSLHSRESQTLSSGPILPIRMPMHASKSSIDPCPCMGTSNPWHEGCDIHGTHRTHGCLVRRRCRHQ